MSAEMLRRAAALMRERAEKATVGEWRAMGTFVMAHTVVPFGAKYVADCYDEPTASESDAAHIASWHPAVALAVADVLDGIADDFRDDEDYRDPDFIGSALRLARAYLEETS